MTDVAQLLISCFQASSSQLLLDPWRKQSKKTMIRNGKTSVDTELSRYHVGMQMGGREGMSYLSSQASFSSALWLTPPPEESSLSSLWLGLANGEPTRRLKGGRDEVEVVVFSSLIPLSWDPMADCTPSEEDHGSCWEAACSWHSLSRCQSFPPSSFTSPGLLCTARVLRVSHMVLCLYKHSLLPNSLQLSVTN